MKVSEYLEKLSIGEIVTNKRLLAALKRKGLIFDYSAHGYLCSCSIYYNEEYNGRVEKYSRMIIFSRQEMRPVNTWCARTGKSS